MAIVHESMAGTARAMAGVSGMADYGFVTVGYPHVPLAIWNEEEITAAARQVAAGIVELLTASSPPVPAEAQSTE